jgi:hypothetical protein
MSVNNDSATQEDTGTSTTTQAQEKTYSQADFDAHMARMRSTITKKYEKLYGDLGDPEELRSIKDNWNQQQQEQALKRGEFDKILQDMASKKDSEIQKRDQIIREFKVEQPLVNLAAKYRSVNPEQVKALLKPFLRLNDEGEVEVVDDKGQVRYQDNGKQYDADTFVKEWLAANPHFVTATPATTLSQGNVDRQPAPAIDLSKLDMTRPDHRKIYAEARRNGKI